jgi:electron transport complex protein RnfG
MEKRPILTTPKAQLYGSTVAIVVVLACGLLGVSMLGDKLDRARLEAEQARNRSWIRSVVDAPDKQVTAADPVEVSDPLRLGSSGNASIVTVREHGKDLATAIKLVAPAGYNGDILLALAVDKKGSIIGLKILSHAETPGFGDVIGNANSSWISSFLGRSLKNPEPTRWQLRTDGGDIDGISGATITASAVVAGISNALRYIDQTNASAN